MDKLDKISSITVKAIENFIVEFEQSKTRPNQVFMTEEIYLSIKKAFPYLIDRNSFNNGKHKLRIVLTKDEKQPFGVSFSYDIENLPEYLDEKNRNYITKV